jgi:regulator of RNase E activity RraB
MTEHKNVDGSELRRETLHQAAINARVFRVLVKQGDESAALHEVSHWAYFPSESVQSEFAEAVRQLGYSATYTVPYPSDDLPFGVKFVRLESVRASILNAACAELALLASGLGGQYDGWETQVISRSGPADRSGREVAPRG